MSTVVKDFMQSETYKLLLKKQNNIKDGSQSKDDIEMFESQGAKLIQEKDEKLEDEDEEKEPNEDLKEPEVPLNDDKKKIQAARIKRQGILFRTSTLQSKGGEDKGNTTPPPRAYMMPGFEKFQKRMAGPMSM